MPRKKKPTKEEVKAAADRAEARAKKNRPKEEPKTTATQAAVNKGYKLISQNNLRNLLKQCAGLKEDLDYTTGILREKIAYAVDKQNLNKRAFAELRKLNKMEAERLADYWDTLQAYMEMAGLMERMESVARLPLEDGKKTEDGDPNEPAPPTEAVSRPRLAVVNDDDKIPA